MQYMQNLYQSERLIVSSSLMRMIRSTALNAATRIRTRQKLPTIVERLRKSVENLFSTDKLNCFGAYCAIANFHTNYIFRLIDVIHAHFMKLKNYFKVRTSEHLLRSIMQKKII